MFLLFFWTNFILDQLRKKILFMSPLMCFLYVIQVSISFVLFLDNLTFSWQNRWQTPSIFVCLRKYFFFTFEGQFCWIKNSRLVGFFFQNLKYSMLISSWLHCLCWEVCCNSYIFSSIGRVCLPWLLWRCSLWLGFSVVWMRCP